MFFGHRGSRSYRCFSVFFRAILLGSAFALLSKMMHGFVAHVAIVHHPMGVLWSVWRLCGYPAIRHAQGGVYAATKFLPIVWQGLQPLCVMA